MKKNNKKTILNPEKKKSLLTKVIPICFVIIFSIILIILLFFSWVQYCSAKNYFIPNIISLIISSIIAITIYYLFKKSSFSDRTFRIIIPIIFIVFFLLQIAMLYYAYFYSGWDVNNLKTLSDAVAETGSIANAENANYLSMYPNNNFLVAIFALIKSFPFLGGSHLFLLSINALLVNISCLFTCLIIKKLSSNKTALFSIFILTPLLIFSPWIIIPYSDTFAIFLPVLVFYIYLKEQKKWWDYLLMSICGTIGFFIKPTILIVLLSIIIIEIFSKNLKEKPLLTKTGFMHITAFISGIILAFFCKFAANTFIDFHQNESMAPVSFIHYLAMGQNEENCGIYLLQDVEEAKYGKLFELKKFINRIISRNPIESITFFTRKLLVDYNDGTFAWSTEGTFYYEIPARNCDISTSLTNYFYESGDYYRIFTQINQAIWIFTLVGCIFIIKIKQTKKILTLELSLIGLFFFVMLFEARARYLFCYVPFFIISSSLGYRQFKTILDAEFPKIKANILKKIKINSSTK